MIFSNHFCYVFIGLLCGANHVIAKGPVVDLGYAQYEGINNATYGINIFHGIRYAQSPSGGLRWKPPIAVETKQASVWSKPINATVPGPQCLQSIPHWAILQATEALEAAGAPPEAIQEQLDQVLNKVPASENCLLLDIIVPVNKKAQKLPVVVEIHGGGYIGGRAQSTDPAEFMLAANGSVVYVQIQYRLGALGFLAGKDIQNNGSANVGLLDQRMSLEWVHKYIHHFGGDNTKVTIMGGSAGGGSVMNQLILYGASKKPHFNAGISEFTWTQPYHEDKILQGQYDNMLAAANCTTLSCLRSLPFEKMSRIIQKCYKTSWENGLYGYGDPFFGPTVDGTVIQDLPSNEFAKGRFHRVPLITDREKYEALIFTNTSISSWVDVVKNTKLFFPRATTFFLSRVQQLYPISQFSEQFVKDSPQLAPIVLQTPSLKSNPWFFQFESFFSDFVINCPTKFVSTGLSTADSPVWKMLFLGGSGKHGATVPYLFGGPGATTNDTLAATMKDYFLSFIIHHNPNYATDVDSGKPHWPRYFDKQANYTALLVNENNISSGPDPDNSKACDFIEGNNEIIRN